MAWLLAQAEARIDRQVLQHGRAKNVSTLDLSEVALIVKDLNLAPDPHRPWEAFLGSRTEDRG